RRVGQGLLEPRGVVGLHDRLRLLDGGARPDRGRDLDEGLLAFPKILLADRVTLGNRKPELAEADELPELRPADADPVFRPREDVGLDPLPVRADRLARLRDGLLEPASVGTREVLFAGRLDHLEEPGEPGPRLEGDFRPDLDGRTDAALRLLEERGGTLEPSDDALEPTRQRREGAHEEREERVSHGLGALRHRLPEAEFLGPENPESEGVPQDAPVDALARREALPVDRLDASQVFDDPRAFLEFRVGRALRHQVIAAVDPDVRREDRIPFDVPIDDLL